jgi:hypothetical protein
MVVEFAVAGAQPLGSPRGTSNGDGRPWDTSMVAALGDLQLDMDTVAAFESVWNNDAFVKRW